MTETPNDSVRYTTKELLAEIRDGISTIKSTLAHHDTRILRLEGTVAAHSQLASVYPDRVDNLSKQIDVQDAVNQALEARKDKGFTRREKIIGKSIAAALLALNVLALIQAHSAH